MACATMFIMPLSGSSAWYIYLHIENKVLLQHEVQITITNISCKHF